MPDFKQQYKNPRPGFGDADHRRHLRAYNYDKSRREVRTRTFDKNRNLQGVSAATSPVREDVSTITDERMKKLIKWREERNRKRKLEAAMKKPAFKVGVVRHSLCSSMVRSDVPATAVKTPKKTAHHVQKRITRATEKRLLAKAATAKNQVAKNPTFMSTKDPVSIKMPTSNTKKQKSFAPHDYCFKPPPGLQQIHLFGLVPMKQTPQKKDLSLQKLYTQTSDDITANLETSTSSRLSLNKQKLLQKLNESPIHEPHLMNVTCESNIIQSSLKEQEKNQTDILDSIQEEKFLSSATDMETPPLQMTPASSEKENCSIEDLITFSPYLTRSRGKKNSRKEGQQRLGIGRRSDEIPTKDTVMQNLNICVEEEERTAQYFKLLLNKETDRLKELCSKWLEIGLEKDIPEDATCEIQQAVGQTNLLINKKFERFRGLVQDCETGRGEMLVTCRDLQGFWDMTYMEVNDCDMRFERLEQRRNRGWQEEECVVAKPAVKKRMPIKKQTKQTASKPSSLRSLILASRKKKLEVGTLGEEDLLLQNIDINKEHVTPSNRKSSTIFAQEGTDSRRSIKQSKSHDLSESKSISARHDSSRGSSTKKMQFSDKSKRMRSPYAAMKISQMCKTPEVELDDTISYVNSDQTPGKSILKKSEESISKETRIKSAHKVNFDDQVVLTKVPVDEEMQTKLSLAAALNRIDNLDLDELSPQECINAERRLNFEVEDSDSSDDLNEVASKIQMIGEQNESKSFIRNTLDFSANPLNDITYLSVKESSPNNVEIITPKRSSRNRIQHKDISNTNVVTVNILPSAPLTETDRDDEMDATVEEISKDMENLISGVRVLRNRIIATDNTPKINRRSSKMMTPKRSVSKEENKSPAKSHRKSSLRLLRMDGCKYITPNKGDTTEVENVTLTGDIVKRRSVRKSVAFDETCVACADNKPVLPRTPHSSRRNRTSLKRSKVSDKDLI